MRVVILTQYYPPELGAPQGRLSDLARRFLADGHEPIILTAMPNYPTGRIFKGYRGLFRRERIDGIQVLRCWLYPNQAGTGPIHYANFRKRVWLPACEAAGVTNAHWNDWAAYLRVRSHDGGPLTAPWPNSWATPAHKWSRATPTSPPVTYAGPWKGSRSPTNRQLGKSSED